MTRLTATLFASMAAVTSAQRSLASMAGGGAVLSWTAHAPLTPLTHHQLLLLCQVLLQHHLMHQLFLMHQLLLPHHLMHQVFLMHQLLLPHHHLDHLLDHLLDQAILPDLLICQVFLRDLPENFLMHLLENLRVLQVMHQVCPAVFDEPCRLEPLIKLPSWMAVQPETC